MSRSHSFSSALSTHPHVIQLSLCSFLFWGYQHASQGFSIRIQNIRKDKVSPFLSCPIVRGCVFLSRQSYYCQFDYAGCFYKSEPECATESRSVTCAGFVFVCMRVSEVTSHHQWCCERMCLLVCIWPSGHDAIFNQSSPWCTVIMYCITFTPLCVICIQNPPSVCNAMHHMRNRGWNGSCHEIP